MPQPDLYINIKLILRMFGYQMVLAYHRFYACYTLQLRYRKVSFIQIVLRAGRERRLRTLKCLVKFFTRIRLMQSLLLHDRYCQMMYNSITLKKMTAVDRIQNMTFDLLSASIGEMYRDVILIGSLKDHRNLTDRVSEGACL